MKRRTFLQILSTSNVLPILPILPFSAFSNTSKLIQRKIPSSGEKIPVIGMGSWITFDVAGNKGRKENMKQVLTTFHKKGGRVIDSSPMYGSSEKVIGELARVLKILDQLWVSTKIWTNGKRNGLDQMTNSNSYFGGQIKVNHVHNIRDFKTHYASLKSAKVNGQIKYIGVSHYVNHAHDELIDLIKNYQLDFVQFNFNIENPHAENKLIPFAKDHGVATIVNRPFQTGRLFSMVKNKPLPKWAKPMGINNWAAYFLKYIISNPGVTCTIPATTQVSHVLENMEAGTGYLPSSKERSMMKTYFDSI